MGCTRFSNILLEIDIGVFITVDNCLRDQEYIESV